MDKATLQNKIEEIKNKRAFLEGLLQRPNLGTLRLDVTQALEELDELIDEYKITFPEDSVSG